jgi:ADP-heptose:LPS heptosyltransferase
MVKEKYGMEMIDCSLEAEEIPRDIISGALTYIHHSRAFIGGPSGLAWLAYYVGKKPILISGVTRAGTEMPDCYELRVDDKDGCKHCYHNIQPFPAFNKCATNKDYECWQKITPEMVMEKIIEIMDVG